MIFSPLVCVWRVAQGCDSYGILYRNQKEINSGGEIFRFSPDEGSKAFATVDAAES